MEPLTWKIGDVKITQIVEIEAGGVIQKTIPNATEESLRSVINL